MTTFRLIALSLGIALAASGCKKSEPAAPAAPAQAPAPTEAAVAPDPYAGWVTWEHPGKLFSVRFPGEFQVQDLDVTDADGKPVPQALLFHSPVVYFAEGMRMALPEGASFDADRAIDGARDSLLASMEGKLVSERPVDRGSLKGREIRYEGTAEGEHVWGTVRIFAVGDPASTYIANAMQLTPGEVPEVARFLDSLQINAAGKAGGAAVE